MGKITGQDLLNSYRSRKKNSNVGSSFVSIADSRKLTGQDLLESFNARKEAEKLAQERSIYTEQQNYAMDMLDGLTEQQTQYITDYNTAMKQYNNPTYSDLDYQAGEAHMQGIKQSYYDKAQKIKASSGMDAATFDYYVNNLGTLQELKKTAEYTKKTHDILTAMQEEQYGELKKYNEMVASKHNRKNQMPGTSETSSTGWGTAELDDFQAFLDNQNAIKEYKDALLKKYGISSDEFEKLAQYVNEDVTREETEAELKKLETEIESAPVAKGFLYSAESILTSPIAGLGAAMESINALTYADKDAPVNTNAKLYRQLNRSETTERAVGEEINNPLGEFMYGVGMSTAKSALSMATGSQAFTLLSFGSSAYASTLKAAQDKGLPKERAMSTALAAGVAEGLFEKMSLDHIYGMLKQSGKVATKKAIFDVFMQAGIEGTEELFTETSNIITDMMINGEFSDYEWKVKRYMASGMTKEEAINKANEEAAIQVGKSFLAGMLSGGITSGVVTGVQSRLSANEKAVVNTITEERIKEKEKDDKKLTDAEKRQIRKEVRAEMEKGAIDTDKIESILGGESYKTYKSTIEQEEALKKTIDDLRKSELNTGNYADLTKAEQKLEEFQKTNDTSKMKNDLFHQVQEFTKNDRLRESYNEKARRGQAFTADVKQYKSESAQRTIQNAMDSGNVNNTNRAHEFVERLAQISERIGIVFNFSDSKKITELGYGVEGKTVNGYFQGGNVTLNMNSSQMLEKVVGHEITHFMEGTEHYDALQQVMEEYVNLKGEGEYAKRLAEITERYKDVKDADAKKELLADLVGEYLFTDEAFVRHLSTKNRNIFQKIFDEIKYLVKTFKGTKEGKKLEEVKRVFEKVWKENGKAIDGSIKRSLGEIVDENNTSYGIGVHLDSTFLDNLSADERIELVKEYVKDLGGQIFGAYDTNGNAINITIANSKKFKNSSGKKVPANKDLKTKYIKNETKQEAIALVDELVLTAKYDGSKKSNYSHDWLDNNGQNNWEYWRTYIQDKNNDIWEATLNIANSSNGEKILYDINPIKKVGQSVKSDTAPTKHSISQFEENATPTYSLSEDSQGRTLSNEQIEFFKDSQIRDENGSLKTMYHGSGASFTVFDRKKAKSSGYYGRGFYFTESETHAKQYGSNYEVYLNITNPLQQGTKDITKEQLRKFVEAVAENEDYGIENYGYGSTIDTVTDSVYGKDDFGMIMDINASCIGDMVEAIQLFNEVNGTDYNGIIVPTETVAFYPNQIKNVDNVNPTENDDINLSLSSENDIAPTGKGTYGKDIALDIPIRDDIAPVQESSAVQDIAPIREDIPQKTPDDYAPVEEDYPSNPIETVKDRNAAKLQNYKVELRNNQELRKDSHDSYNKEIAKLQAKYDAKKNKNTLEANNILQQIERKKRLRDNADATYEKRINDLKSKIDKMNSKEFKTAEQRMTKQQEYRTFFRDLMGDISTWVDKKMGLSYKTNTLRRNLRDIVRDKDGNRNIPLADAIYDALQGLYNHNEALLNKEANKIKQFFRELNINAAEDAYIQMLGEYRHNPDTKILAEDLAKFYEKNKDKIDTKKVDEIIDSARKLYDSLYARVNAVLKEQGMQEIGYREGYFPHFTEEKQSILAKILNWKTHNNDIPTDIAGLTEQFNPERSYQSFSKHRTGDSTDYSFMKGLDTYVSGALDWIYHIEDIQKRRAFENEIRYQHSEQGVKEQIDKIREDDMLDAEQMQEQIDLVYKNARNPLNNFVSTFRTQTNTLAGKKSSMDRQTEEDLGRRFYSTVTNISNRVTANMVVGSVSSALTNFIPITQSWAEVSPLSSLRAMKETLGSYYKDDGVVEKSDFLTNRLNQNQALYQSNWDKIIDKAGILMEWVDNFTSQTVWRSKYHENISNGMSENAAIKNADQFAENVIAGRSRGNNPAIFDSKNPFTKVVTAFQLEVNNQYQYMFKDLPQEMANEAKWKLAAGYGKIFLGAYAYNMLFSALTGRDAAFDPVGIIEDLLGDLGLFGDDDEEEPVDTLLNFTDSVLEEVPFVGGLLGGGRIPISSALPYDGLYEAFTGTVQDVADGDWKNLTNEWLNPASYLLPPVGGGQMRKTLQGLSMFDDDLPIAGSYTSSGNLRYAVEDTPWNRIQAGVFGQWANKNAQEYIESGRSPLSETQTQELADLDIPMADYWKYRDGLSDVSKVQDENGYSKYIDDNGNEYWYDIDNHVLFDSNYKKSNVRVSDLEKASKNSQIFDYITGLDYSDEQKEIMFNNAISTSNTDQYGYVKYINTKTSTNGKNTEEVYWYDEKNDVLYNSDYEEVDVSKLSSMKRSADRVELDNYNDFAGYDEFDFYVHNPGKYAVTKLVGGYSSYKEISEGLGALKPDKDSSGKTISGSLKKKKVAYINNLDLEYGEKIILYRSQYTSDDRYNYEIVEYLNSRDDISYQEMVTILQELGMTVDSDGNVRW